MDSITRERLIQFLSYWVRFVGVRRLVGIAAGVCATAFIAWFVLSPSPVPVESVVPRIQVSTTITSTPRQLLVHVAGAVKRPGVYALPPTARLVDAVRAAGGSLSSADLNQVNLAQTINDAEQVFIPSRASRSPRVTVAPRHQPRPSSSTAPSPSGTTSSRVVNVNTANATLLESLPGVGPATAKAIISYRTSKGPFTRVEDLLNVPGIGPSKLDAMRADVSVS